MNNNNKAGVWICTNENGRQTRGRTKVYQPGSKIYLNDNDEFEIELYNPTTYNVKAEIKLDGKSISGGGLVLRSGQRVYLECFPDSQKKFTFKTYEIEDSKESKQAISNNGRIEINFYRETIHYNNWTNTFRTNCFGGASLNDTWNGGILDYSSTGELGFIPITSTALRSKSKTKLSRSLSTSKDTLETGQVDGGADSNQCFESISMDFESWVLSSYSFQLLPISQRPVEAKTFKTKSKKSKSKVDELTKLKDLLESQLIDQEEFDDLKSEILG